MPQPTALITGVAGQDGVYLARHLLARGYRVVGTTRRPEADVAPVLRERGVAAVALRRLALDDATGLEELLLGEAPAELYHLAAQSVVHSSWDAPLATSEATATGALRILEAVRRVAPATRLLIASSAEIFGEPAESPQSERTAVAPRSPYGIAKAFAFWMTAAYRREHGVHASSAILYNHESPLRPLAFVTRKITDGVARIAAGEARELRLGNLEARRDWGHAADYVDAMFRMLQQDTPGDVVIGTGVAHSVRDVCEIAFGEAGLDYREHVVQDPAFLRPADPMTMVADPRLAAQRLAWRPAVSFEAMVREMARADLQRVRRSAT